MNYSLPFLGFSLRNLQKFLQSNILLYCIVLLLILKIVAIGVSINIPYNIFFADITKATLENLANQTRISLGLDALSENPKLERAAQLKAEDMVKNQYFSHTSPTGITPWFWLSQAGYNYKYAGENLAIGFFDSQEVYNAWLNSPSHKENLLNPNYKEIGTAILQGYGNSKTIIVVQLFGGAKPAKTIPVAPAKIKPITPAQEPKIIIEEPVETPVEEIVVVTQEPVQERVLSQSIESKIQPAINIGVSDIYAKMMNYIMYSYATLLQNIIYGISFVVIGIMLTLIFFNASKPIERKLVFRATIIVILLSLATAMDKGLIISVIPHQLII